MWVRSKTNYMQNNIDFFAYKVETLNCFPSAGITLQECSQDNNTVSITTCQFGSKCRREEIFYLSGHREGGSGFIQITILNFISQLLFDLLFTIYIQTERCCITCTFSQMFLVYFVLLKDFLIVLYHLESLFNRKIVQNFTQVRIKKKKKKVLLKRMVFRGGYKKVFCGEGL